MVVDALDPGQVIYYPDIDVSHQLKCSLLPWDLLWEYRIQHGANGPFMSHLATQLGYSAGEFQALQLIVLAAFGVVD